MTMDSLVIHLALIRPRVRYRSILFTQPPIPCPSPEAPSPSSLSMCQWLVAHFWLLSTGTAIFLQTLLLPPSPHDPKVRSTLSIHSSVGCRDRPCRRNCHLRPNPNTFEDHQCFPPRIEECCP